MSEWKEDLVETLSNRVQCCCGYWADEKHMFWEFGTWHHWYPCDVCFDGCQLTPVSGQVFEEVVKCTSAAHSLECIKSKRHVI